VVGGIRRQSGRASKRLNDLPVQDGSVSFTMIAVNAVRFR
jgi:hypothetical protein